ncbi:MAG: tryptophan synthase subunit beta [Sulfurimonas sp. RIFOXYD12_FULL_33_39]|uniref:tryptophan synthase subunit beta n=1 Tax=unclassified Sulfurimonas TaxID=2623549 RepID=UPI0008D39030|nr:MULTISPECIES: tryptophan synthase subunit beta [unclassified Sulfurimonas]OHE07152.1 MAG: tryptophan synthase subunit beta [Sulfurimonas sp. RIFCSPLOWO2_12_FULL_34_6]OHE09438.1 MAG: tryptophan synthase subunit beta [Sulfurimonas sp. RIFOXYD12_FULL_33_39]OHE12780.1 MAG: tryptophan synthase subunit beta [Sulfurimonas sp. RIFOXYD2_FULL_34_21]DAB27566.1 MAG TPA: tryptophan synthase subunit beta [Sulfurimonas sp. UBA10385]
MYIPSPSKFDPNENGHFGIFGGRYVPETLMPALLKLEEEYNSIRFDKDFWTEVDYYLKDYVGRPSPLYYAKNISDELGAKIYLKREDLNHTGAHKVNNVIAQGLMAKRLGYKKIIAETGAGQHGVATATICALLDLECEIFMGAKDVARQELNVFRMKLLGAKVNSVESGSKTLKDAMNDAIRHWVTNARDTFYIIGTVAGPHPYPMMVRDFQAIIGYEARAQILEKEGRLPEYVIACIGGGSNAIGMFQHFLEDKEVGCIGIEAGGHGIDSGEHGCSLNQGRPGVLHGQMSYLLQDEDGQILEAHSISAGLDYPGIGPEHAFHHDNKSVSYDYVTDKEALDAFVWLSRKEGIIPAFESAHAVAYLKKMPNIKDKLIIVNISGRGDKDMIQAKEILKFD